MRGLKATDEVTFQIGAWLHARKMSQSELARRLKVSPALVSKWMRGEHNFTLSTIQRIAKVLELDVEITLAAKENSDA